MAFRATVNRFAKIQSMKSIELVGFSDDSGRRGSLFFTVRLSFAQKVVALSPR
jgi:hypothetical protein